VTDTAARGPEATLPHVGHIEKRSAGEALHRLPYRDIKGRRYVELAAVDGILNAIRAAGATERERAIEDAARKVIDRWMQPSLANAMAFDDAVQALRAALDQRDAR
jgi:hypothetical protein